MIVTTETGGLGNRIKSWVSAMRLDADARVYWPQTDNMPARFEDLFTNACAVESIPENAIDHKSWRLAVLPEDERYLPAGFATVGAGPHPVFRGIGKLWWSLSGKQSDRYQYMIFPKQHSRRSTRADARHIDLEYGRIPEYFRVVYADFFKRIVVDERIQGTVDEWARINFDESVTGVQVRTWRDDPRRYRKYHKPSIKRMLRLMRETSTGSKFFVVSDSDDVVPWLVREFGEERILSYPRNTQRHESWRTAEGMVEDLIDMLLLARANRLFASYLSTFSETAWWLGGTKAEVSVF